MKNFFCATIIVISFVSCDTLQTVIDVDLPPHEPKLVVNSVNEVGEKWKAYVSVSQAPLSTNDFVFLNANFKEIKKDDNTIDIIINLDDLDKKFKKIVSSFMKEGSW